MDVYQHSAVMANLPVPYCTIKVKAIFGSVRQKHRGLSYLFVLTRTNTVYAGEIPCIWQCLTVCAHAFRVCRFYTLFIFYLYLFMSWMVDGCICEYVLLASPSRRPSKFALSTHTKFYSCVFTRICVWTKTFVVRDFRGYTSLRIFVVEILRKFHEQLMHPIQLIIPSSNARKYEKQYNINT